MQQQAGLNGVLQRNCTNSDASTSASSGYMHFTDTNWQNPHASSGMLSEPWAAEMHQTPLSLGIPAPRSISQLPHTGMIGQGSTHTDAGYVKRRSQTDSFSNYLPVLRENHPMAVRELRECPVPGQAMSRCHAHPSGACNHSWALVDEPRVFCNSADSRLHRFAHNGASLPFYPISSHARIASGGSRTAGDESGIRLQTQIATSEQDIRPVVGQVTSRPHIP